MLSSFSGPTTVNPQPPSEGPLTPASSNSSRRVSAVSLEAIWAAASARTCGASRLRCQRRALGSWGPPLDSPVSSHHPEPAPIPFRDLAPKHEFPPPPAPPPTFSQAPPPILFSPNCFPFPAPAGPSFPLPSPGLHTSVPPRESCFSLTMTTRGSGGRGGPEGAGHQARAGAGAPREEGHVGAEGRTEVFGGSKTEETSEIRKGGRKLGKGEDQDTPLPKPPPPPYHQTCSKLPVAGQLQRRLRGQSHRVKEVGCAVGSVLAIGWPGTLPGYKLRMIDR